MEEKDLKNEKSKKILIILVVLMLFGATYYYYGYMDVNSNQPEEKTLNTTELKKELPQKKAKTSQKPESVKKVATSEVVKDTKHTEVTADNKPAQESPKIILETKKEIIPQENQRNYISPTTKSEILASAASTSGKHDPFSYIESGFSPFVTSTPENTRQSSSSAHSTAYLPAPPSFEKETEPAINKKLNRVNIKGFIGQRVLLEIGGYTEALRENQEVRGVKVIAIDLDNKQVTLDIDGKKVNKTLKNLVDKESAKRVNIIAEENSTK